MSLLYRWLSIGVVSVGWSFATATIAQPGAGGPAAEEAAVRGRESVEIEAYDGPPIFLPQVESPPEPTVTTSRVIKENFPDKETVRFERRVVQMSDDTIVSDGPQKEYYSSGQLYVTGQFKMGRADGQWTYHHENGQVAKEIAFVNGKPDGEVRVLDDEGNLLRVRRYSGGKRDGLWVTYAEASEQPILEQRYAAGKADGTWTTYYTDGQMRQQGDFKDGKRDGLTTEWALTGEKRGEVMFVNGVRDGKTTIWQRDGRVIERLYEQGKLVDQKTADAPG